ncbi:hypothetical protein ACFFIC_05595 [Roseomonas vinacea]|uniref:Uncharacterized protein n=1 Tax=Muricoccus vinaceus TaxID=424704 RepID=A0ABV6IN36_9PROT
MGGRVDSILSLGGLAILAVLLLGAVLRLAVGRTKSAPSLLDGLEAEAEGTPTGRSARSEILPSFEAVLDRVVRPRHLAHPGWERLDGAQGVPGRTVALFEHQGSVYALNGASRFDALLAAGNWILDHPDESAVVVRSTEGGAGQLMLRPEIGHPAKSVLMRSE